VPAVYVELCARIWDEVDVMNGRDPHVCLLGYFGRGSPLKKPCLEFFRFGCVVWFRRSGLEGTKIVAESPCVTIHSPFLVWAVVWPKGGPYDIDVFDRYTANRGCSGRWWYWCTGGIVKPMIEVI
jgi:hypothetical protein